MDHVGHSASCWLTAARSDRAATSDDPCAGTVVADAEAGRDLRQGQPFLVQTRSFTTDTLGKPRTPGRYACPTRQLTDGRAMHAKAVCQLLHGHLRGVGIQQRRTIRGIQTSLRLTRFFDHGPPRVGPLGRRTTRSASPRCLVNTGNQRTQGLAGV